MQRSTIVVFLAVQIAFVSCSVNKFVADHSPPMLDDQTTALYRERSLKHAREASPALLKMLDGFIVSSPDNTELLVRGAAQNCGFALVLIEDEDTDWASELYLKGYGYAVRALSQVIDGFDDVLDGTDDELRKALAGLDADDVDAVFWAGACLGAYIKLNLDDAEAMADIPKVLAFIGRAMEMDDTYFYGGPHLFMGMFNGMMGEAFGGNPGESRRHFEEAIRITNGRFLLAKVFFAQTYMVQVQNKKMFQDTLREVVESGEDVDPDLALPNAAARRKAERLLEDMDDFFVE